MISGANEQELTLANARADIIMALDNTSTYASWLIIDVYIESLGEENERLKNIIRHDEDKSQEVKELRNINDKLSSALNSSENKNERLKNNWNELKEWLEERNNCFCEEEILYKMQVLEEGEE